VAVEVADEGKEKAKEAANLQIPNSQSVSHKYYRIK
jgi:hypothetical protein